MPCYVKSVTFQEEQKNNLTHYDVFLLFTYLQSKYSATLHMDLLEYTDHPLNFELLQFCHFKIYFYLLKMVLSAVQRSDDHMLSKH